MAPLFVSGGEDELAALFLGKAQAFGEAGGEVYREHEPAATEFRQIADVDPQKTCESAQGITAVTLFLAGELRFEDSSVVSFEIGHGSTVYQDGREPSTHETSHGKATC